MNKLIIFFGTFVFIQINAQEFVWENLGLAGNYITDIAIDDSGNIYASANSVYKSTDNGITWLLKNACCPLKTSRLI